MSFLWGYTSGKVSLHVLNISLAFIAVTCGSFLVSLLLGGLKGFPVFWSRLNLRSHPSLGLKRGIFSVVMPHPWWKSPIVWTKEVFLSYLQHKACFPGPFYQLQWLLNYALGHQGCHAPCGVRLLIHMKDRREGSGRWFMTFLWCLLFPWGLLHKGGFVRILSLLPIFLVSYDESPGEEPARGGKFSLCL